MRATERWAARILAVWLGWAAVQSWASVAAGEPGATLQGWQPFQPALATAGWRELACLPGVGIAQAKAITRGRAGLGVPVSVDNVGLIPGVGPQTVEALRHALAHEGPG